MSGDTSVPGDILSPLESMLASITFEVRTYIIYGVISNPYSKTYLDSSWSDVGKTVQKSDMLISLKQLFSNLKTPNV